MFKDQKIQLCLYGIAILLPVWFVLDYLKITGTDPLLGYVMDTVKVLTAALLVFVKPDGGQSSSASDSPVAPDPRGSLSQPSQDTNTGAI